MRIASETDRNIGWTLDPSFLKDIKKQLPKHFSDISLEELEKRLITAYFPLNSNKQVSEVEKIAK